MADIGVGIIGWGLAGAWFHGAFVRTVEGLDVVAVATSRDIDGAAYPRARRLDDAAAVIADPAVQLVVVASPNRLHVEQARAAIDAGKHVVVDKPVARTAAEMRDLAARAEAEQVVLTAYQNRRFDGDFRTVQDLLQGDDLGALHAFTSRWPTYRPSTQQRSAWKAEPDPMHGLLYDLGPHLVDQALVLFGVPAAVSAEVRTVRPGGQVTDWFRLSLRYPGGPAVLLEVDQLDPFEPPRFSLRGEKGAYEKHGVDAQEAALRAGALPGEGPWGEEAAEHHGRLITPEGERRVPTRAGDYRDFYRAVRDAIRGAGPNPVDPQDVVAQLVIIETAIESARQGRELEVRL